MRLSVIIPYYNAEAWIGRLLDSLLDQDLEPSDYEIVVVDDGSEEEPVALNVNARFAGQMPPDGSRVRVRCAHRYIFAYEVQDEKAQ